MATARTSDEERTSATARVSDPVPEQIIVQERLVHAPPEVVWKVWTDPAHVDQWWGPNGFRNETHSMDFRVGGTWRYTMHGPDGRDYANWIRYESIEPAKRLEYAHGGDSDAVLFHVTVTFEARDGGTLVTMHSVFPTVDACRMVVEQYGALEGGKQTLARLSGYIPPYLEGAASTSAVISRLLDAPRAKVFEAWSTPEALARWWGPKHFTLPNADIDFRTGGAYRMVMRDPAGNEYAFHGKYLEIVDGERIVFDATIMDGVEVVTTVTFTSDGGRTLLTVTQTIPSDENAAKGQRQGWSETLEKLDAALARSTGSEHEKGDSRMETQTQSSKTDVPSFEISREFDAPRSLMWEVMTTPDHLMKWFGPKGVTVIHAKMDLRVGGIYHYGYRSPSGEETWGKQQFLEVTAPERLVYLQAFSDKDGGVTRHPMSPTWPSLMHATTALAEVTATRTRMDISWHPHEATDEEIATFDAARPSMSGGFEGMFSALEAYLASLVAGGS